jgi:hypothetical protein
MKPTINIDDFSATLFWDVDKTTLDFEAHAAHVIEKALNNGTWDDFRLVLAYYGKARVTEVVKNLRYMNQQTLQFSSVYFQIPITEMRCYIWQQSNPTHWNY